MFEQLFVHEFFIAPRAYKSEQLNHLSDPFVHFSRSLPLIAHRACPELGQTVLAVQSTAALVSALLAVVHDTVAELAQEQMVDTCEACWPELTLFDL